MFESEAPSSARLAADAVLVGVTAVWGLSFVLVKNALAESPPVSFLFWRFLVAAILAIAIARRRFSSSVLRDGAVAGSLLAAGMILQVLGQVETTASNAAFLTGLSVVLTPFAAYVRARRVPSLENAIGIALASGGFVLLTLPQESGRVNRGDLLVLGCGILFAFYIVELGERAARHDARTLTVVQLATVALAAGTLWLFLRLVRGGGWALAVAESRRVEWSGSLLASVLWLGSVGTVGTFLGQTWAQRHMSATHAAILFALEPVFAALFAGWLLRERLRARGIGGAVLVLAGIVASEVRVRKNGRGRAPPLRHETESGP